MITALLGLALMAGAAMAASGLYEPAQPVASVVLGSLATLLMICAGRRPEGNALGDDSGRGAVARNPVGGAAVGWAALLLAPAALLVPWPGRAALLLLPAGWLTQAFAGPSERLHRIGRRLAAAGWTLTVMLLVLAAYTAITARNHDLPGPLAYLLCLLLRAMGVSADADGAVVHLHSWRQMHPLAATWDALFDPMSLLLVAGAAAWAAWGWFDAGGLPEGSSGGRARGGEVWRRWVLPLAVVWLCWQPLRWLLLTAVYLDRVMRFPPQWHLHTMNHYFSLWVGLATTIALALLAAWAMRWGCRARGRAGAERAAPATVSAAESPVAAATGAAGATPLRLALSAALIAVAGFVAAWALHYAPPGPRKAGRVVFVERKSEWEPTDRPYDTRWYVEPRVFEEGSGYNYYVIYDWLSRCYDTSRLMPEQKLDRATLADCDVLVIKTPTERYAPEEIAAVQEFVREGGGLLLIGDHTNYVRSSTIMNDVVRPMGFVLRPDLLFSLGESAYEQRFQPGWAAHPIVQHMPPMDFAVSCSVDPGWSFGRAVIRSGGLFSMGPDHYHSDNFHPVPQHVPEMRYGAFVQVWTTTFGRGRVTAFTDSTIFSNFCLPQEGKADIMFGMIEWLNRAEPWGPLGRWTFRLGLLVAAAAFIAAAIRLAASGVAGPAGSGAAATRPADSDAQRALPGISSPAVPIGVARALLLAAIVSGWAIGVEAVGAAQRAQMPPPPPQRPLTLAAIDRGVGRGFLSKGPYTTGEGRGFGLAEQWVQRLGWFVVRRHGLDVFDSQIVIVFHPGGAPDDAYIERLRRYVSEGGVLVVIDSADNADSTANSLLWPFGLSMPNVAAQTGELTPGEASPLPVWPDDRLTQGRRVDGGAVVLRAGGQPVAAMARHGRGAVLALGCGELFQDSMMGETWMEEPSREVRARFDAYFALLRFALALGTGSGSAPLAPPADAPLEVPQQPSPSEQPLEEPR